MKTVYKYELPPYTTYTVFLPAGAQPLTVQLQDGALKLWALVDTERDAVPYTLCAAGTGQPLDLGADHIYLGTVQRADGAFVFHYFWLRG